MSWDFKTDPEFQELLDWTSEFVRHEIEPLTTSSITLQHGRPLRAELIPPLQQIVKDKACGPAPRSQLGAPATGR